MGFGGDLLRDVLQISSGAQISTPETLNPNVLEKQVQSKTKPVCPENEKKQLKHDVVLFGEPGVALKVQGHMKGRAELSP